MEGREGVSGASGAVTVVASDAPSEFHVSVQTENPTQVAGSSPAVTPAVAVYQPAPPPTVTAAVVTASLAGTMPGKKKRGRPRKYGPDGSVKMALSPKPISSSTPGPPVIDFTVEKRGKIRPVGSASKSKMKLENLGNYSTLHTLFQMRTISCYISVKVNRFMFILEVVAISYFLIRFVSGNTLIRFEFR